MKSEAKRIIKAIEKIYDGFLSAMVYIGVSLILFMMLCISASVFLRHTKYAFGWQLEASEYILILTTFFATGWLLRTGGHIRVDIIPNFVKGRKQDLYNGVLFSIVALVCLAFTINGASTAWDAFIAGTLQIKVYTFPKWILISLIPFGGFFLFVESLKLAYRYLAGKLILIVDDEADIIDTLAELLEDYRVHKATDFVEASEQLRQNAYDAVVLDIMGVEGFDLLKMAVSRGFPTIMLTAHAFHPDSLEESMQLGAVSFVPKEEIGDIDSFVDDAINLSKEDARRNFYRRLGAYFDYRFGADWDQGREVWAKARQVLTSEDS